MNQQRDIAQQIEKARAWLRTCRDMRWAAEARLRAGGEYHEVANKRAELRAAEGQAEAAFQDLRDWEDFGRRQAARKYG
jgi:hypothetical protein